jgi:hypothetical protein
VRPGETVVLAADIETPPGGGTVVRVEWDLDGTGTWPVDEHGVDGTRSALRVEQVTTYAVPGTYFPAVRVTAHRDGDRAAAQRRLVNLGRVRVVVAP